MGMKQFSVYVDTKISSLRHTRNVDNVIQRHIQVEVYDTNFEMVDALDTGFAKKEPNVGAVTNRAYGEIDKNTSHIIRYSKEDLDVAIVAHESLHAAMDIYGHDVLKYRPEIKAKDYLTSLDETLPYMLQGITSATIGGMQHLGLLELPTCPPNDYSSWEVSVRDHKANGPSKESKFLYEVKYFLTSNKDTSLEKVFTDTDDASDFLLTLSFFSAFIAVYELYEDTEGNQHRDQQLTNEIFWAHDYIRATDKELDLGRKFRRIKEIVNPSPY